MPNQHRFRLMRPQSNLAEQLPGEYPASVNTALARYLYLVASPPKFTEAEWNLLRDACNGWATQMEPVETLRQGLAAQIDDAMTFSGLARKWNVDQPTLRQKVENMTELEAIATIHAIECFWSESNK